MAVLTSALVFVSVTLAANTMLSDGRWDPSPSELSVPDKAFVQFGPDGAITGYGGCNRFFGRYTIDGNSITIGPLARTRKGCYGLMEIEGAFVAKLETTKTFETDGSTLFLYDAFGNPLFEFVLADEPAPKNSRRT